MKKLLSLLLTLAMTLALFPTLSVSANAETYGLVFDAASGKFYLDAEGDGTGRGEYTGQSDNYAWDSGILTLKGFLWETDALTALTIIGDITLELEGENTFKSNGLPESSVFVGISCGTWSEKNNLTITGDGTLNAIGGNSEADDTSSYGMIIDGNLTISGGTVNVSGGAVDANSFGVYCSDTIEIKGGTLNAIGASALQSFGIDNSYGAFEFEEGTVTAICNSGAFYDSPIIGELTTSYAYKTNSEAATDPGNDAWMEYYNSTGTEYSFDAADKFVKFTTVPFALVNGIIISGVQGTEYEPPLQTATLTLYLDRTKNKLENATASGWFTGAPSEIDIAANAIAGGNTITLTFGGTPTADSTEIFNITIPDTILTDSTAVEQNNNARFDVAARVDAAIPTINEHPQGTEYPQNTVATELTVTATVTDVGVLSYRWYESSDDAVSTDDTTVGTNSSSFTPSTANIGTKYYYVVVTNTNNNVNGTKSAEAVSATAAITVKEVLESDKEITAFTIPDQINDTYIYTSDEHFTATHNFIMLTMPYGTNLTALTPTIQFIGASISPETAQNFTDAVEYTVTAADGSERIYTVTVTEQNKSPEVASVSPSGSSVSILTDKLVITFDIPMAGYPDGYDYDADDGEYQFGQVTISGDAALSNPVFDGATLTFQLTGLSYGTAYTVTVDGFLSAQEEWMADEYTHSFTTAPEPTNRRGGSTTYYTVTFDTNGGSTITSQRVVRNSAATKPTDPTKDGFTFAGWYTDKEQETEYDFSKGVTATITIYAKWTDTADSNGSGGNGGGDRHEAYIIGYPNGSFGPDNNMTRAETAMMLYRLLYHDETTETATFSDIPENEWYTEAVRALAGTGMLKGYPDGSFKPEANITRAEFTAIVARLVDAVPQGMSFPDVTNANGAGGAHWAYEAINTASGYGWIDGYPDGTFRPDNYITRAEAVKVINAVLERKADKTYIDNNTEKLTAFPDVKKEFWAYYEIIEASNTHDYEMTGDKERWVSVDSAK